MRIRFQYKTAWAKYIHYGTAVVAAINFFIFFAGSLYLGGDALNGYHDASGYFLCAHGGCTAVSKAIWTYSYWHSWSSFAGIFLAFIEPGIFYYMGAVTFEYQQGPWFP